MTTRFLIPFLRNSRQNREKFIKNKKIYIETIVKNRQQNYNKTITRKMNTYHSFGNGPKLPNEGYAIYLILAAFGFNISVNIMNANSNEE
jgi:hypothetical protein